MCYLSKGNRNVCHEKKQKTLVLVEMHIVSVSCIIGPILDITTKLLFNSPITISNREDTVDTHGLTVCLEFGFYHVYQSAFFGDLSRFRFLGF